MKSFLGDLRKVGFSLKFKNENSLIIFKLFSPNETQRLRRSSFSRRPTRHTGRSSENPIHSSCKNRPAIYDMGHLSALSDLSPVSWDIFQTNLHTIPLHFHACCKGQIHLAYNFLLVFGLIYLNLVPYLL